MEDPNSTLLPYILETLSRKPELCDTFDHICKEIEDQLIADNITIHGNVRNALQRALNVGQSLGIITLSNETIRMPFNFRTSPVKNVPINGNQQIQQPAIGTGNPVKNTNERNIVPTKASLNKYNNRKGQNISDLRGEHPDFMIKPPTRGRRRPQGRSYMRRNTTARSYSRGRSGRVRRGTRRRARSGYVRRNSRRR